MPIIIEEAIFIEAEIDRVFDITNDLPRWVELFGGEYTEITILKTNGNDIEFQITNDEGKTWISKRNVDRSSYSVKAERLSPKFPFKYMMINWDYSKEANGTKMTWKQEFEVDDSLKDKADNIYHYILSHTKENQERIKQIIEKEAHSK